MSILFAAFKNLEAPVRPSLQVLHEAAEDSSFNTRTDDLQEQRIGPVTFLSGQHRKEEDGKERGIHLHQRLSHQVRRAEGRQRTTSILPPSHHVDPQRRRYRPVSSRYHRSLRQDAVPRH